MIFGPRATLRAKLAAGAVASILTLLVVLAAATLALRDVNAEFGAFADNEFAAQAGVATLRLHLGEVMRLDKEALINIDDAQAAKALQSRWHQALGAAKDSLQSLRERGNGAAADELGALLSGYEKSAGAVIQDSINGRIVTATEGFQLLSGARAQADRLAALVGRLSDDVAARGQERRAHAQSRSDFWRQAMLGVAALSIAVFAWLAWAGVRAVTVPLTHAVAVAQRIAKGDLAGDIATGGVQEFSQLLRAMAAMQARLREMLHDMQQSSQAVAAASVQIAAGNGDLSSRTERTAADLLQTAAAMSELARCVGHTEHTANAVTQLAHSATGAAQDGSEAVASVCGAMDQLERSASRITEITGVIERIALQTRLLALNAAVEAARAGVQGRGFSVVAQEVGVLAERAASASAEIASLARESVHVVDQGTQAASDAQARMERINASVARMAHSMEELLQAAANQTSRIRELSGAVSEVEAATQQNAALVQQSAATSELLHRQASRLQGLTANFKLAV
ncbi:methyl-accepting chemotaxis protein [Azohydromonas lata]|uniref:methyl-accepting chemotaxis protein n=1 Tax=Azohydromonas lata TaxID=45677 RepID=UPI00082EE954|nr:methyl-accepting chemotaxis protein [Azohydromonas lata]